MANTILFFIMGIIFLCTSHAQTRIDSLNAEAAYHYFVQHDRMAALQKAEEIILLDSLSADAARFIQDIKRPPKEYYLGRILQYPNVPLYNYLYSRTLRNEKKPDSMNYYLQKSIDLDPKFFWGYVGLASMKAIKKATAEEALDLLNKAEIIRPNTKYARNWIAISYLSLERYDESLPLLYAMVTDEETNEMFGYVSRAYAGIVKRISLNSNGGENALRSFCDSVLVRSEHYPLFATMLKEILQKYPQYPDELKRVELSVQKFDTDKKQKNEEAFQAKITSNPIVHLDSVTLEAHRILENVRNAHRSMSTMMRITKLHYVSISDGKKYQSKSEILTAFMRPNKYCMENHSDDGKLISSKKSDGEHLVTMSPQQKQYIRTSYAGLNDTVSRQAFSLFVAQFEQYGSSLAGAQVSKEETIEMSGEKIPCYVLSIKYPSRTSPDKSQQHIFGTVWIDKIRNVILRDSVTMYASSPGGMLIETNLDNTIKQLSIDAQIPESQFAFDPPDDWKEVKSFERPERQVLASGTDAQGFQLKDLQGNKHELKSYRGKVVLLDFWATWCGPCVIELPRIENIYKDFKNKGLIVFGINNEKVDLAKKFISEKGYTFPTLSDASNSVADDYKVSAIPTVVIINKEGKIANYVVGVREESVLRKMLLDAGL